MPPPAPPELRDGFEVILFRARVFLDEQDRRFKGASAGVPRAGKDWNPVLNRDVNFVGRLLTDLRQRIASARMFVGAAEPTEAFVNLTAARLVAARRKVSLGLAILAAPASEVERARTTFRAFARRTELKGWI